MIFRRGKNTVTKNMNRMDKLVTGIIITGAAASILGLSRTKKGKSITHNLLDSGTQYGKKGITLFGKTTVKILSLFQKK